jgi:hypothetical protein
VQLSGDFFLMPPEAITSLERLLSEVPLSMREGALVQSLSAVLEREHAVLSGADVHDIAALTQRLAAHAGIMPAAEEQP